MEIKPIAQFEVIEITGFRREACNIKPVRQLEADFKEAIEALEEISIQVIEGNYPVCLDRVSDGIIIIEKAYGEKWDKIRRGS